MVELLLGWTQTSKGKILALEWSLYTVVIHGRCTVRPNVDVDPTSDKICSLKRKIKAMCYKSHAFLYNFPFFGYKFCHKYIHHTMFGLTEHRWEQRKVTKRQLSRRSAITMEPDQHLLCRLLLFNNFFCRERVLYYGFTILKFRGIETF